MRQPLVAGNWKMNGSRDGVRELLEGIKAGIDAVTVAEVAVCPPYIFIPAAEEQLNGSTVAWGGQNLSTEASGAFTGEVAAPMLVEFGCKYCIIGHSERRSIFGETDEQVAHKFTALIEADIIPILCVGELLEERESGQTERVVGKQIDAVLNHAGINLFNKAVIAYEPVWAIGTGKTASPAQAQEVHAFIRQRLAEKDPDVAENVQILYGGSVKPDNAAELFAKKDIDGGLIGGASLDAEDFLSICCAAN